MKQWLSDNGMENRTHLEKRLSPSYYKNGTSGLADVLSSGSSLPSHSVRYISGDGECGLYRWSPPVGLFQFFGANRTGRWAERHIQMQNLPQNHLEDFGRSTVPCALR
jgi:DNA polymerase